MFNFKSVKQTLLALSVLASTSAIPVYAESFGKASWYGPGFHNRTAANGSTFNQYAMTTACAPHIKMNSMIKVTNVANGKSVTVKCTDRGAFHKAKYGHRTLDLSKGAFAKIANLGTGVIRIKYQILK